MNLLRVMLISTAIYCCLFSQNQVTATKRFQELPDDVLLLVLQQLNVADLLNVAETGNLLLPLATWVYRYNHGQWIRINGRSNKQAIDFIEDNEMIVPQNDEATARLLRVFGSSPKKLQINYRDLQSISIEKINRLICEQFAKQLQHLEIAFDNLEQHSDLIPTIFPNVQHVYFSVGDFGNASINLNEKFPQMRTLELGLIETSTDTLFDQHFPHLTNVDFQILSISETQIERMFQKNTQIKTVIVGGGSTEFLRIMHDNLPYLECIELRELPWIPNGAELNPFYRFESVKMFTLHLLYQRNSVPQNIPFAFGNLEEMKLIGASEGFQQWIPLIENNTNIHKLTIVHHESCSEYAYLVNISLPNLNEVHLRGVDLNAHNEFIHFFNGIKGRARNVKVHLIHCPSNTMDLLVHKLTSDWQITFKPFESMWSNDNGFIDIIIMHNN